MGRSLVRGLVALAAAAAAVAGPQRALADDPAAPYLGVWNYDQPDRASGTDIASMDLAGYRLDIPQIGTVRFSREPGGVVGHTDQGCTWHFRVGPDGLDLVSRTQYCFNKVIDSGYNIDVWHVGVRGDREQEALHANSYFPGGLTFGFVLDKGSRTRADATSRAATLARYLGTWNYDPPQLPALVNMLAMVSPSGAFRPAPERGAVRFTAGPGDTVVAHTDDGCAWTLAAHGNTAELAPAGQRCARPDGVRTLTFWSLSATAGEQASVQAGIDPDGTHVLLNIGSAHRA